MSVCNARTAPPASVTLTCALFTTARGGQSTIPSTRAYCFTCKGWTAEEICLAYCLTEPSIASVLVECEDPEHLAALAAVPDRDMPPGLAAQVEMARFAPMNDQSATG